MRDYRPTPIPHGTAVAAYQALRSALTRNPPPALTRDALTIQYLGALLANFTTGILAGNGWTEAEAEAKMLEHADEWLASLILGEAPDGTPMLMDPAA